MALLDRNIDLLAKTAAELQKAYPDVEVMHIKVDVTDEDSMVSAHAEIVQRFGRIDYAVNNAGSTGPLALTETVSSKDFRTIFDINVAGVWLGQREQIRQMLKQEPLPRELTGPRQRGVIINTASMLGLIGTPANTPGTAYTATKHAVMGLTRGDSNQYAPKGIRINAVCPGYVNTPLMEAGGGVSRIMEEEMTKVPIARFAEPEEIAQAISFLASPMSSYMAGTGLVVDGYVSFSP